MSEDQSGDQEAREALTREPVWAYERVDGWRVLTLEDGTRIMFTGPEEVDARVWSAKQWGAAYGPHP